MKFLVAGLVFGVFLLLVFGPVMGVLMDGQSIDPDRVRAFGRLRGLGMLAGAVVGGLCGAILLYRSLSSRK